MPRSPGQVLQPPKASLAPPSLPLAPAARRINEQVTGRAPIDDAWRRPRSGDGLTCGGWHQRPGLLLPALHVPTMLCGSWREHGTSLGPRSGAVRLRALSWQPSLHSSHGTGGLLATTNLPLLCSQHAIPRVIMFVLR